MKRLTCEMCGSTDLIKQDGVFVCQTCGCKYSVEEAKKMMVEVVGAVKVENTASKESLLKRAQMLLLDKDYNEAERCVEQALDIDPENADAYLCKLMARYRVTDIDSLKLYPYMRLDKDYAKFLRFATAEQKEKVQTMLQYIDSTFFFVNWGCCESSYFVYGSHSYTRGTQIDPTDKIKKIARNGAVTKVDHIENITISQGVKEIQLCAFSGCSSIVSVTIPDSVEEIGVCAFDGCTSLTNITIPNSVKKIEQETFRGCTSLSDFIIPDSVKEIGKRAFAGCSSLKSIIIPKNVKIVGEDAFFGCTSLTNITILAEINRIGHWGLGSSLNSITIPDSVTEIDRSLTASKTLTNINACKRIKKMFVSQQRGCYVATAVYGSYDCPQVWTLRRFRDHTLAETWYGRAFIRTYYAVSPTLVKWFGHTEWFKKIWRGKLDCMVAKLQSEGIESTPYEDKTW